VTIIADIADVIWRALWHAHGLPAALLLLVVLLLALAIVLVRRERTTDPAWHATGVKQTYTGYDKAKANAGVQNQLARQRDRMYRRQQR